MADDRFPSENHALHVWSALARGAQRLLVARTRLAVAIAAIVVVGSVDVAAQVHYETVGTVTTPAPDVFFSVDSPLTCSDSTQTLPNHGYLKVGTTYNVDARAEATAHCEVWYGAQYWWSTYRYFSYINWTRTPPGGSPSNAYFAGPWPPPASDPTVYDTRSPGTGNGTATDILLTEGEYTMVFKGQLNQTSCSLPEFSEPQNQVLNAVVCRPKFSNMHHAADADPVIVFLPSDSSFDDAWTALEDAVASWNNRMPADAQYAAARGTCNMAAGCVQVGEHNNPNYCGISDSYRSGTTGVIIGDAIVNLRDDWRDWSPESLTRTFMHELGHHRGLGDYDIHNPPSGPACAIDDAVMQDKFPCGPTSTPMHDVTTTDSLPAASSVYGNLTKTYCGF